MRRTILATMLLFATAFLAPGAADRALAAPATPGMLPGAVTDAGLVHKVHRWRGRWHCDSRHHGRRGWHWHRRACRDYNDRHRPRSHRGYRRHDRPGCSWSPRHGLRCQF